MPGATNCTRTYVPTTHRTWRLCRIQKICPTLINRKPYALIESRRASVK